MSSLSLAFREKVSKLKDYRMKAESEQPVSYPTGFLSFDYRNGCVMKSKVNGQPCEYISVGIQDGSMVMVIGRSGSGKTSWCIQAAANIIRKHDSGTLFIEDVEASLTESRKQVLTKMTLEEMGPKIVHRNVGITIESFYERIKIIHDIKLQNREDFLYPTGYNDLKGEPIFKLQPTCVVLDSLALLTGEQFATEDELSGQMSTTANAKMNASVFRKLIPMLKAANIILFVINHINQKVEINPMQRSKAQVSYLKQGETLPGGNTPIYVSNLMIRFDDSTKLTSEKEFGIDGSLVDVTLVKSRSNKAGGSPITLVFNQEEGYDPVLSLYILLKQNGRINGQGIGYYLDDHTEFKFAQKNLKQKLQDNVEFQKLFVTAAKQELEKFLYRDYAIYGEETLENSITSMMEQKLLES